VANTVKLAFAGDATSLESAMKTAGGAAETLATNVKTSAGQIGGSFDTIAGDADRLASEIDGNRADISGSFDRLAGDLRISGGRISGDLDTTGGSLDTLGGKVDGSVEKFRGWKDGIDGTTDIAEGFRNGDISQILGGFADLADGIATVGLPALQSFTKEIVEKVSPQVLGLKDKLAALGSGSGISFVGVLGQLGALLLAAEAVDVAIEKIFHVPEGLMSGPIETLKDFADDPGGLGFDDWTSGTLRSLRDLLPFHSGGIVPGTIGSEVPIMAMAGERVVPRGQSAEQVTVVSKVYIDGREIHQALLRQQRLSGELGLT
jgi:hypothetical protein